MILIFQKPEVFFVGFSMISSLILRDCEKVQLIMIFAISYIICLYNYLLDSVQQAVSLLLLVKSSSIKHIVSLT